MVRCHRDEDPSHGCQSRPTVFSSRVQLCRGQTDRRARLAGQATALRPLEESSRGAPHERLVTHAASAPLETDRQTDRQTGRRSRMRPVRRWRQTDRQAVTHAASAPLETDRQTDRRSRMRPVRRCREPSQLSSVALASGCRAEKGIWREPCASLAQIGHSFSCFACCIWHFGPYLMANDRIIMPHFSIGLFACPCMYSRVETKVDVWPFACQPYLSVWA
jgi:hypothetical protein